MRYLKRFNESIEDEIYPEQSILPPENNDDFQFVDIELPSITYDEAISWISKNYPENKVIEMLDNEIDDGNWVDHEQMEEEGYESNYDYYVDYGRGEAEDAIIVRILDDIGTFYDVDPNLRLELYYYISSEYESLSKT